MANELCLDLKQSYFEYLVDYICDKRHKRSSYLPVLDLLHGIPFVVVVEMDDQRMSDGLYLRERYLQKIDKYDQLDIFEEDKASVLEVLIGIAQRLEFQVGDGMIGDHTAEKFWELLANLDIEKYDSRRYFPLEIKEKVRNWMLRKYDFYGNGSIFPVKRCEKDMRELQIWDQMSVYVMEKYL